MLTLYIYITYVYGFYDFYAKLQNHLKYLHYFSDETSQHKASRLLIHGITREPSTNNFTLVTDYMVRGSLRTRLQNPDLPQFEWSSVLLSLRDLSICLSLMHEAGLIHRDIHSGNILCGFVDLPYLADFGLSRNLSYGNEEKIFGILPYVAPEVLNKQPYTQAADIYSFGMILWEYLSHAPPFSDRAHDLKLCLDIQNGLRPKILSGTPTIYANLMKQCWDANPEKRPTAQQVREIIFEWHTAYVLYRSDKPLTKEQEEFGKIFAAAEEYRLNIGHGGAGKGQIVGFAKHPEAWTVSRLLDFSFLEKNPQKPELEIVDEEKEILDKTGKKTSTVILYYFTTNQANVFKIFLKLGYLITYRSTQLLEIPDED